jgi:hypothetical protein
MVDFVFLKRAVLVPREIFREVISLLYNLRYGLNKKVLNWFTQITYLGKKILVRKSILDFILCYSEIPNQNENIFPYANIQFNLIPNIEDEKFICNSSVHCLVHSFMFNLQFFSHSLIFFCASVVILPHNVYIKTTSKINIVFLFCERN